MKFINLLLLLIPVLGHSQTWKFSNLSMPYDLNKVCFINDSIGFTVGDNGIILKSFDAGENWTLVSSGITNDLQDIVFYDDTTGYICSKDNLNPINGGTGIGGTILKTTDAGNTWNVLHTSSDVDFTSIGTIVSPNTVLEKIYVLGTLLSFGGDNALMLELNISPNVTASSTALTNSLYINDAYMLSPNTYVAVGYPNVGSSFGSYRKVGGVTMNINTPYSVNFNSIDFIDGSNRCIMVGNAFATSGNGGKIYEGNNMYSQNNYQLTSNSYYSMYNLNSVDMVGSEGWAVGNGGTIVGTNDSGYVWNTYNSQVFDNFNDVYMLNSCIGWLVGENGVIGRYNVEENVKELFCQNSSQINLFNLLDSSAINLGGVWTDSLGNSITSIINPTNLSIGTHSFRYTFYKCGMLKESTVELDIVAPPNISLNVIGNVSCNNLSDGIAQVNLLNGNIIYADCIWGNGTTNSIAQSLPAGFHSVLVTDTNSCSTSDSVLISEPLPIIFNQSIEDVSCNSLCDGSISISNISGGTPPYSTTVPTNLCMGNHTIYITDSNGCIETNSYFVNEPDSISYSSTISNVSCFNGNNGAISVVPLGGTYPYNINWATGDTLFSLNGLSTGYYDFMISDTNNCHLHDSLFISQQSMLIDSIFPIICFGESFAVGNNVYHSSGTYTDTLTSMIGCDSIIITHLVISPQITNQQNSEICQGLSIIVGNNSYTMTGTYIDTLQSFNGCDSIVTLNLTVLDTNVSYTNVVECDSYTWNGSTYDSSGTYTYLTSNAQGCDSTAILELTVNTSPISQNIIGEDNPNAFSTHTYATSLNGNTYAWDVTNGNVMANTNNSVEILWSDEDTGAIIVTETNSNNCQIIHTLIVNIGDPLGCLDPSACNYNSIATIDDGSCVYLSASISQTGDSLTAHVTPIEYNSSVNWYNVQTIDDSTRYWLMAENTISFAPTFNCSYFIVASSNECSATSTVYEYAASARNIGRLALSPNPTNGILKAEFLNDKNQNVKLYLTNTLGKVLNEYHTTTNNLDIDLSMYPNGTYFLSFNAPDTESCLNEETPKNISQTIILNK